MKRKKKKSLSVSYKMTILCILTYSCGEYHKLSITFKFVITHTRNKTWNCTFKITFPNVQEASYVS